MDVGHLREGTKPSYVRKLKFGEAYPEANIREGADELTLRADEVTLKAFINIDRIEYDRWGSPLVERTGMPSAKEFTKELKGKNGKSCTVIYREMSRTTGAKKTPSESQKAKALWARKATKDRSEECYDPARKENIFGKNKNTSGAVRRAPQRPNHSSGQSVEVLGEPF